MLRSFKSRLEALEALEGKQSLLPYYSADDRYSAAALLLRHYVMWEFGKPGDFAPHAAQWHVTAEYRAYVAEQCAAAGLDDWTLEMVWELCRWLNVQDADVRAARIAWYRWAWQAAEQEWRNAIDNGPPDENTERSLGELDRLGAFDAWDEQSNADEH